MSMPSGSLPPRVFTYPHRARKPSDQPIDPFLFNDCCRDLYYAMRALREADDLEPMTAEKGEQLRQHMHDLVGDMQHLLWHVEPHIKRFATPELQDFEREGKLLHELHPSVHSATLDVLVEYEILEGQMLYNQRVVFESLKTIYDESLIKGVDGGFIVPASPEDIKLLEVIEWVKSVKKVED